MRARTLMVHTSGTKLVSLVHLVYLVDLVHLLRFVQPTNKRDKPNKPIRRGVRPGGVLVDGGARVRDRRAQR